MIGAFAPAASLLLTPASLLATSHPQVWPYPGPCRIIMGENDSFQPILKMYYFALLTSPPRRSRHWRATGNQTV